MRRGQAEALMPMLDGMLAEHSLVYRDLERLAVGIGPGNFTGIRISVAAARGLAMGLGIPAIGVTGFEAVKFGSKASVAAIPAPREMAYIQVKSDPPQLVTSSDVPQDAIWPRTPDEFVRSMALFALQASSERAQEPPAPLYIRPADAAPQRHKPPVILDAPG